MRKDILERKEEIIDWINQKKTKAEICRNLKCKFSTLNSYLNKIGVEYKGNKGRKGTNHKESWIPAETYLEKGTLVKPFRLKNILFRDHIKERICESCGGFIWKGMPIPLEIHHINGDRFDNRIENIQIICPNCHAQTSNYRGLNIRKTKKS